MRAFAPNDRFTTVKVAHWDQNLVSR
jgi:hypothetical protein